MVHVHAPCTCSTCSRMEDSVCISLQLLTFIVSLPGLQHLSCNKLLIRVGERVQNEFIEFHDQLRPRISLARTT